MTQTTIIVINVIGILAVMHLTKRGTQGYIERCFPELQRLKTPEARAAVLRRARPWLPMSSTGPLILLLGLLLGVGFYIGLHLLIGSLILWWVTLFPCVALGQFALCFGNVYFGRERMARRIRRQLADRTMPICVRCGYSLEGQREARCPECGTVFDPELLAGHPGDAGAQPPGPPEPIELQVEYSAEVFRRGMHLYWMRTHACRTMPGIVVLLGLLAYFIVEHGDRWYVGALGTLAAIMVFQLFVARRVLINASLEKWGSKADRAIRMRFEDSGIEVRNGDNVTSLGWDELHKLWRTRRMWLLFQSRYEPMLLPTEQIDGALRQLLTRRMLQEGLEVV